LWGRQNKRGLSNWLDKKKKTKLCECSTGALKNGGHIKSKTKWTLGKLTIKEREGGWSFVRRVTVRGVFRTLRSS